MLCSPAPGSDRGSWTSTLVDISLLDEKDNAPHEWPLSFEFSALSEASDGAPCAGICPTQLASGVGLQV